jgi:hypothetical protein
MSLQGGTAAGKAVVRSTCQLYRDCLRLVQHMAGARSKKATQLKLIVRSEFRKNANVTDPERIDALKANAVRALANYLMLEASSKDSRFMDRSAEFVKREVTSIKPNNE